MSTEVFVSSLPGCDFCSREAEYDGRTTAGYWANMCQKHFDQHGVGLGTGSGQKLAIRPVTIVETAPDTFELPDTSAEAFKVWMHKVDAAIEASTGLSAYDLPDVCYRDWFEDGMSPRDAAATVIAEDMEEMGFDW